MIEKERLKSTFWNAIKRKSNEIAIVAKTPKTFAVPLFDLTEVNNFRPLVSVKSKNLIG